MELFSIIILFSDRKNSSLLKLENASKSLEAYNQALNIFKKIKHQRGEAVALGRIGVIYYILGNNQKALNYFQKSLYIQSKIGDRVGEARTLGWLQSYWIDLGNRKLAVIYGKQSVNIYQDLRKAIYKLDKDLQESYLGTVQGVYRKLSEILIAGGWFNEAQQVLAMLKEDEYFRLCAPRCR